MGTIRRNKHYLASSRRKMPNAKSKEETEMKEMVENWDGIQFMAKDPQVWKEYVAALHATQGNRHELVGNICLKQQLFFAYKKICTFLLSSFLCGLRVMLDSFTFLNRMHVTCEFSKWSSSSRVLA